MTEPETSSTRVPYDLRPRKQVERRMMVHAFQVLAEAGFPISNYRYAGFGAFFFVDFIIFRRILGINDMISIEHDRKYEKRVDFNRPFGDLKIRFQESSEYISEVDKDKLHILWLDYDGAIDREKLADLIDAASRLVAGSALIVTFDVDFDKAKADGINELPPDKRSDAWHNRFLGECADSLRDPNWSSSDFAATRLYKRTIDVASRAINTGIFMRDGKISFQPLFSFLYADGHEMLTLGGIICSQRERTMLRKIEWKDLIFIRRSLFKEEPFRIDVPVFTRKERLHLDSCMPCEPGWAPHELFETSPEDIDEYNKIHRYCPLYAELLL